MIVGIDPGASGAIAWLDDFGRLIEAEDLPVVKGVGLMPGVLAVMLRNPNRMPTHAFVEKVSAMPPRGKNGEQRKSGAVSMFTFGRDFGQILGVLAGLGVGVTLVPPATWKTTLRIPADKSAARARAAQLWPGLAGTFARVRDDGRAEAALIGLYGANTMQGHGSAAA